MGSCEVLSLPHKAEKANLGIACLLGFYFLKTEKEKDINAYYAFETLFLHE